ncbi:MptD family putative ECF transporter S component [Ruminococcus sp. OA3]|uniref:MptD family putative ECF transporter S component n=1 Tax=Ruminococcus sp. OA3 TaxID=2914164 RepID=UPI001F058E3F|nr:MptD family putative ECF transporter S component [Ruminococcus sp. OA3]MCH1983142.1 MptD family putative ECF transporter S component [Ruminococcus sp. OA3]
MMKQLYPDKKGLTVRDIVSTGIFTALFFVFYMLGGVFFAPNPVLTFYMPMGSALLCGPVFMVLAAKVHKRWSITILGTIIGLVLFATGMHWAMALGVIVCGILADVVAGFGNYRSIPMDILAYMVLSFGSTGSYIVFFIDPQGWTGTMLRNGTTQDYITTMQSSCPAWMPPLVLIGTLAVAGLSAWAGSRMVRRQFDKAGITG